MNDASTNTRSNLVRADYRLALLVGGVAFLAQVPGLFWGTPGGKSIVNALRILDGDVPYRDFWTMYAPGHFYLVALLFKIFGVHVWVSGIAVQVMVAITSGWLVILSRRLGLTRTEACVVGAAYAGIQWGLRPGISSYEPAVLLLIPALDRIVLYARGGPSRSLVTAGILCGVAAWFKHDVAFYVVAGTALGLIISWLVAPTRRPANWVSPVGVLLRLGAGAGAAVLPVLTFFAWQAGPDAWLDLIQFPATDFRVVRGEAYPRLLPRWSVIASWLRDPTNPLEAVQLLNNLSVWIQANIPQIVFVAGLVTLIRHRGRLDSTRAAVAIVCLATMPFFWASAHVQHNTNFTSLWLFGIVLGAALWMPEPRSVPLQATVVAAFFLQTGGLLVRPALEVAEVAYYWNSRELLTFPAANGVRIPRFRYEFYQPIVSFIREHVPESEAIYVGLTRHDSVVISNQAFYYLAGRPVASRYNELHPGIIDREDVQREMVADINRLNVRCAVLWNFGWPKPMMDSILAERRAQIPEIGATTLDEFFQREFEVVDEYGEFVLVWRKGVPRIPLTQSPRPTTSSP